MTRTGGRPSASAASTEMAISPEEMARDARSVKIIRAARLLVDSEAEIIEDGAVAEVSGKILYAGPRSGLEQNLRTQGFAEVTEPTQDLGDVTLMPGLFDCHVHLVMDPGSTRTASDFLKLDDAAQLTLMASNSLKLLDAGVTTARDLGCPKTLAVTLRDQIACGERNGPRLLVSNAPITVFRGHACAMGGEAEGIEGVRAEVRKRVAEGADVIKVMTTGGFMTPGSHPSEARYSLEELQAIREEARSAGLMVTTHAQGVEGIRRAVEAGFDCIEHCSWIVDKGTLYNAGIAKRIVDKDIAICPTMNTACSRECYFCPWDARDMILSNLSELRAEGARTIIGTDAGIGLCHFERYADGLVVMQEAGYTLRQIIHSATAGAALACGLQNTTGKLRPGFAADLVAFQGNPLQDINAFKHPTFVMARGQEHTLTPIPPLGDHAHEIKQIYQSLRKGAGFSD